MNNFTLSNDIAPKPDHPSNSAFKPDSSTAILREKIWKLLKSNPNQEIPLAELVKQAGEKYSKVYNAAKYLCLKHLAVRSEEEQYRIKKVGMTPWDKLGPNMFIEDGVTKKKIALKPIIKLKFVEPFASKKGSDSGTSRTLW